MARRKYDAENSCENKHAYHSWHEAEHALRVLRKHTNCPETKHKLRQYKCRHCRYRHIGHNYEDNK